MPVPSEDQRDGPVAPAQETPSPGQPEPSQPPSLFIRGFSDVTFDGGSAKTRLDRSKSAFELNEPALLITSQLSRRLSVLSELTFHFVDEEFEIERMHLRYSHSDLLNILFFARPESAPQVAPLATEQRAVDGKVSLHHAAERLSRGQHSVPVNPFAQAERFLLENGIGSGLARRQPSEQQQRAGDDRQFLSSSLFLPFEGKRS